MGYCIAKKAGNGISNMSRQKNLAKKYHFFSLSEAGNKVVEKGWPTEAVGVVVRINNKIQVIFIVYLYNFQFLDSLQRRVAMRVASVCETSVTFSLLTESKKMVFKIFRPTTLPMGKYLWVRV